MTDTTAIVSDLHLGVGHRLDDLRAEEAFSPFLIALDAAHPSARLVILGDAFDFWCSVPESECRAAPHRVPLEYSVADRSGLLRAIAAVHGRWFDALGRFATRHPVTLVAGDHDQALVHADLQRELRDLVGEDVAVEQFYCDPELGVYAEHGNQFDVNNQFEDFGRVEWAGEARGYFFVRLFLNAAEWRDPHLDCAPGRWASTWHRLARAADFHLLAFAIRRYAAYLSDRRVPRHLVLAPRCPRAAGSSSPSRVPDRLFARASARGAFTSHGRAGCDARSVLRASESNAFSSDALTELLLRKAYFASPEVRDAVDEVLGGAARIPQPGPPRTEDVQTSASAEEVSPDRAAPPEDVSWAGQLFDPHRGPSFEVPGVGQALDPGVFRTVVLGHTHDARREPLANGSTYLNSGCWSGKRSDARLPVVIVRGEGASLAHFSSRGGLETPRMPPG